MSDPGNESGINLQTPPAPVRLMLVVGSAALVFGAMPLLYLVCWYVLPRAWVVAVPQSCPWSVAEVLIGSLLACYGLALAGRLALIRIRRGKPTGDAALATVLFCGMGIGLALGWLLYMAMWVP